MAVWKGEQTQPPRGKSGGTRNLLLLRNKQTANFYILNLLFMASTTEGEENKLGEIYCSVGRRINETENE